MYNFETSEAIEEMMSASADRRKLEGVLQMVHERCAARGWNITDYRWQSLVNHVNAMISRSVSKEKLDEMDAGLFAEIGEDSLQLAQEVTERIGGIRDDEKYLLSVHFEAAK